MIMKNSIKVIAIILSLLCCISASGSVVIRGNYPSLKDGDIVILTTDPYGDPNFTGYARTFETKVSNHIFLFNIPPVSVPTRFRLRFKDGEDKLTFTNKYLIKSLNSYYYEDGDDVMITENANDLSFSGKGSEKYLLIQQMKAKENPPVNHTNLNFFQTPRTFVISQDSAILLEFRYLNTNRSMVSHDLFYILKAGLIGRWYGTTDGLKMMNENDRKHILDSLSFLKTNFPISYANLKTLNALPIVAYGDSYTNGIFCRYMYDSCYVKNLPFHTSTYYAYVKENFEGLLRERLVTNLFFDRRTESEDNSGILTDALSWVTDSNFRSILSDLKSHRMVGGDAFDFNLIDDKGNRHQMAEFKGKVVFIDFWFTGCGNCIQVAPYLEKLEEHFKDKPVVFLSINVDTKGDLWKKSIASKKYTTRYAINLFSGERGLNSQISKYYNVTGGPTLILIDKKGTLMMSPTDPRFDDGNNITSMITQEVNRP